MEKCKRSHRNITDGNSRDPFSVDRQAGHAREVVQVPEDTSAILGATHQEAEGD